MPAVIRGKKNTYPSDQISRSRESALLRRFQKRKDNTAPLMEATGMGEADHLLAATPGQTETAEVPFDSGDTVGVKTANDPSSPAEPSWRVVTKTKNLLTIEQTLNFRSGLGSPFVHAALRLTTAVQGYRKREGLTEAAYLVRLEVLALSPKACIEGFFLGPWQMEGLRLEAGALITPEPLWSAFKPFSGSLQGRLRIADVGRHRLLDLPWKIEGLIPGTEVLPAEAR